MTLGQNGVSRYGHFSDFLEYFWGLTSKLVCISKLMYMAGKTNLNFISNNLAKMAINWHKIGQMPLWHKNINFGITWSFFIQF